MGIRSRKRKTKALRTDLPTPSSPRRRRGRKDHLPSQAEWRDWAALPSDVLWVILSRLPQADVLRGAGRACASWRRLAVDEPLLWRRLDLAAGEDEDHDAPDGWHAMARAAVDRSARWCESFRGRVDGDFLLYLADSAPLLRSLDVTCRFDLHRDDIIEVAKKLPLLEQLVLLRGHVTEAALLAFLDHCPRLDLLDAGGCHTLRRIGETTRAGLETRIKDLRLPRRHGRVGGIWFRRPMGN